MSVSLCWVMLSVAALGTFVVVDGNNGPCWFDPPPGDFGSFRIVNDSASAVTLRDCLDASCTEGENPEPVAAHAGTDWTYEMCSGPSVGVRTPSGVLLGCLVLPVGEPPAVTAEAVSRAGPCQAG